MPLVEMSEEEIAARYLNRNGLCAIPWNVVQIITHHYSKTHQGDPILVYNQQEFPTPSFKLMSKRKWRAMMAKGRRKKK